MESIANMARCSVLTLALTASLSAIASGQNFTIGTNFTGTSLSAESANGRASIPPDTMGAVGPNDVVELLNSAFAIYDKSGVLKQRITEDNFWNNAFVRAGSFAPASFSGDSRILYDPSSSRWYAVAADNFGSANSRLLVGVTTGSDPSLANWRGFTIKADSTSTRFADNPTIGLDASGLFISSTMFPLASGSVTNTFVGVPKSSLMAATPSIAGFVRQQNIDPATTGYILQPAVDLSNSSLPLTILASYNKPNGLLKRSDILANFFTTKTITPAFLFIPVAPRNAPPLAHQPGVNDNIATGDGRFESNVVLQNDHLWATQSVNVNGRAAIEWYEINRLSSSVLQSGLITDLTKDLYYPSIAVNADDTVAIGFSGSDNNTPTSSYAVVGQTMAGTTTFGPITQLKLGTGSYFVTFGGASNRWGDYSATVLDPSNPNAFWTLQEFADGTNNWGVQITQLIVPEPSTISLAAIGLVCVASFAWRRRDRTGISKIVAAGQRREPRMKDAV